MEIYLDHAATTFVYRQVADTVSRIMCTDFGNPSSMHLKGIEAERTVKESAKKLARILKCQEKEIFFTSGGTESNNWALIGGAMAAKRRGKRIITSAVEHASVASPLDYLQKQGFEIVKIGVDENGILKLDELKEALNEDTILVSVMIVNNEVGALQPIKEISSLVKAKNKDIIVHADAIQAFGKYIIHPKKMGIDLMSVSGHKIHGPKGTGFLYISDNVRVMPLIYGGGQQNGMRSGTDNVPGIAALAQAAEIMYDSLSENVLKMRALRNRFIEGVSEIPSVFLNGSADESISAPHIADISFVGIRSEVMLHTLEEKEIYVSAGSACSSHKRAPSATLTAMGLQKDRTESALRFSFCEKTTEEEIDRTLQVLKEAVPALRRYKRH